MAPVESMLTTEEKNIVVEVRRKNLLFKSIPISLGGIFGSKQLVTRGIVKQKWLFPMYFGSTIVGLYVGIKSTPSDIKARVMRDVPDGMLSQIFRDTEKMSASQRMDYLANLDQLKLKGVATDHPSPTQQRTTTSGYQGNTDMFTQPSPPREGSQDRLSSPNSENGTPAPQPGFSYSKQRQLHNQPYGGGGGVGGGGVASSPPPASSFDDDTSSMQPSNTRRGRRNQYGDEME